MVFAFMQVFVPLRSSLLGLIKLPYHVTIWLVFFFFFFFSTTVVLTKLFLRVHILLVSWPTLSLIQTWSFINIPSLCHCELFLSNSTFHFLNKVFLDNKLSFYFSCFVIRYSNLFSYLQSNKNDGIRILLFFVIFFIVLFNLPCSSTVLDIVGYVTLSLKQMSSLDVVQLLHFSVFIWCQVYHRLNLLCWRFFSVINHWITSVIVGSCLSFLSELRTVTMLHDSIR